MSKNVKVKKLYMQLNEKQISEQARARLIMQIVCLVVAAALILVPSDGYQTLYKSYFTYASVLIGIKVCAVIFAVYCLVGHFTLYKLRSEVFEAQLPALRGDWHTFAAIEIQTVLFAACFVFDAVLAVIWPEIFAIVKCVFAAAGTFAAWKVRMVTYNAFKNLADKPLSEPDAESAMPEEVEEFYDGGEKK